MSEVQDVSARDRDAGTEEDSDILTGWGLSQDLTKGFDRSDLGVFGGSICSLNANGRIDPSDAA